MAEFVVPNAMGSAASDRATCPYFAHRLPVALDAERATFVFVQAEDVTETGVRTWGEQLAALWAARAPGPKPGSCHGDNAGGCDHVFSYPMFP